MPARHDCSEAAGWVLVHLLQGDGRPLLGRLQGEGEGYSYTQADIIAAVAAELHRHHETEQQ